MAFPLKNKMPTGQPSNGKKLVPSLPLAKPAKKKMAKGALPMHKQVAQQMLDPDGANY